MFHCPVLLKKLTALHFSSVQHQNVVAILTLGLYVRRAKRWSHLAIGVFVTTQTAAVAKHTPCHILSLTAH